MAYPFTPQKNVLRGRFVVRVSTETCHLSQQRLCYTTNKERVQGLAPTPRSAPRRGLQGKPEPTQVPHGDECLLCRGCLTRTALRRGPPYLYCSRFSKNEKGPARVTQREGPFGTEVREDADKSCVVCQGGRAQEGGTNAAGVHATKPFQVWATTTLLLLVNRARRYASRRVG